MRKTTSQEEIQQNLELLQKAISNSKDWKSQQNPDSTTSTAKKPKKAKKSVTIKENHDVYKPSTQAKALAEIQKKKVVLEKLLNLISTPKPALTKKAEKLKVPLKKKIKKTTSTKISVPTGDLPLISIERPPSNFETEANSSILDLIGKYRYEEEPVNPVSKNNLDTESVTVPGVPTTADMVKESEIKPFNHAKYLISPKSSRIPKFVTVGSGNPLPPLNDQRQKIFQDFGIYILHRTRNEPIQRDIA
jgi:hypothetical protein